MVGDVWYSNKETVTVLTLQIRNVSVLYKDAVRTV